MTQIKAQHPTIQSGYWEKNNWDIDPEKYDWWEFYHSDKHWSLIVRQLDENVWSVELHFQCEVEYNGVKIQFEDDYISSENDYTFDNREEAMEFGEGIFADTP